MATSNKMRALNRLPYDFEDGLKVKGIDLSVPGGAAGVIYDTDNMSVQTVLDNAKPLSNYEALRAYNGRANQIRITDPGIAGFFYKVTPGSADDIGDDNGGTIIRVGSTVNGSGVITQGTGARWKRHYDGSVNVKWFGAKGDGVTDDTASIQAALNASTGKKLTFPTGAYRISFQSDSAPTFGLGLDVPSNITIEFDPGSSIKPLAHNRTIYQIFRVWNKTNVTFLYPNIDGNKAQNSATTGESGMGIDIRGGSNVTVINAITNNCWGDGIYICYAIESGVYVHPKNVYILNHKADGCRRQGISVISADGLVIENPVWSNIAGTSPEAGIDIEPNDNNSELKGIRVINPKTYNCTKGVYIYLGAFAGAVAKTVDIEIIDHSDDGSTVACMVDGLDTSSGTYKVDGAVKIVDPVWVNSDKAALSSNNWDALGPSIQIVRPVVVDNNRDGETTPIYGAPFVVGRDTGDVRTYAIGNVVIENPSVSLTSGSIPKLFAFQDSSVGLPTATTRVQKVFFRNPVKLSGLTDAQKRGVFRGQGNISDDFDVWSYLMVGSNTLTDFHVAPYLAQNASTTLILGSGFFNSRGPDLIFKNPFTTSLIVQTDTGGNFVGMTAGQRLQSFGTDAPGSYLRVKPLGSDRYLILDRLGIWNTI